MVGLYVFLGVYLFFLFFLLVIGYLAQRLREGGYYGDEEDHIAIGDLSVIIPFRNEEHRITDLLNSIQELSFFPKEFIFVDDHSSDEAVKMIESKLNGISFKILTLPEEKMGKKQAIRHAITTVDASFILTLDADVQVPKDYFLSLARLKKADMYILPALMKAKKPFHYLFEVDLLLINAINAGLSGLSRPIIASGANLLFSKKAFEKFDRYASHQHMMSGDDIYLLRDFRKGKANIRLHTASQLAVVTETPQSIREFFHQRIRWVAKTGDVKDALSTCLAIVQAAFTIGILFWVVSFIAQGNLGLALVIWLAKSGIDLLAFLPFFNRSKRLTPWLLIPLYEIIYPFYLLLMLALMYVVKPEWKGRILKVNH
ncbi:MAG: glycosyltransferase [Bacteroidota bacterium]